MRKQWHIKFIGAALVAVIIAITATTGWSQVVPDHTRYASMLKTHVKDGVVDYQGFKKEEQALIQYLDQMAKVDPDQLSRSDQMAFYINAYNAWTIKLILDNYPGVTGIKELGSLFQSPWKKKFVKLNGKTVTLDHIEHDILRPVFNDPRIHFAINCAAKSCPPLMADAYTSDALDRQLDQMTKRFINDSNSTYMKADTLYVSSIFKWFREDFGKNLADFVATYAQGELAGQIDAQASPKIKFLKYDWSLNGN